MFIDGDNPILNQAPLGATCAAVNIPLLMELLIFFSGAFYRHAAPDGASDRRANGFRFRFFDGPTGWQAGQVPPPTSSF